MTWHPSIPVLTKEQKAIQEHNADMASKIFRVLIGQLEQTPIEEVIDLREPVHDQHRRMV